MPTRKLLWLLIALTFSMSDAACGGGRPVPPAPNSPPPESPATPRATHTPTSRPLPDLTITDVKIEPAPTVRADGLQLLIRGLTYTFRVEVKNIGAGPVRGAVLVGAPYGCGRGLAPNDLFAGNDLAPGQSHLSDAFSVTIPTDFGGKCTFTFTVDPNHVHEESDKSPKSNVRELSFVVP